MNILFVCKANVGRSQMAKGFFNKYSKYSHAESAGTYVHENDGKTIGEHEKARFVWEVMDEEGIDVRKYVRRQLTPKMMNDYDKVYVMTESGFCPDYLLDSPKSIFLDIEDAKGTDYAFHIKR